jgi:hypothetical protein
MSLKEEKVPYNQKKGVKKEIYNIKLENINKMISFLKKQNKK